MTEVAVILEIYICISHGIRYALFCIFEIMFAFALVVVLYTTHLVL